MPNALLNLLFPPQCLHCDVIVPKHGTLCQPCWQKIQFITEPMCVCCGLPFDYSMGEGALCGECLREHPAYGHGRAVFRYNEYSGALVTKLKYHDQAYLAAVYGAWLAQAGAPLIAASDVIVPVPLHYWRFVGRRYNQSALLAQALSKKCGLTCLPNGLMRTRKTLSQTGLSRSQRENNVRGAFAVTPRFLDRIKDKTILLIDDVMTTGATIDACSKALLKAGAVNVNVLTLARTV